MALLKQSTTRNRLFKMVLTSDHTSPATGKSPTVNLSKDGAAFGAAAGTVTEIANGWYKCAYTTADTGTLGDLAAYITAAACDDTDFVDQVVLDLPGAKVAVTLAAADQTGNLTVNVIQVNGTAQTGRDIGASVLLSAGTGTGQLDFTSGVVKSNATQWLGGTIPAVNVTGVPKVDVVDWLGAAPNALVSGRVDASVGAMAANVITASAINAAALNGKGDWSTVNPTNLTAAQIATGVWQDAVAGDFTTASSIGKALYTGNFVPGATSGLAIVGSAMTLAANQHVIVDSGTVTTLTNLPAIPANWLTAAGINAAALNGKGDWNTTTPPTSAAIATAVWTDTTAGDFTTALSVGKSLMNGVTLGTGLTVNTVTNAVTLPSIPANWITAAGINAAALNGKGDWATVNPTNLTAAQIATGIWQDTTAGDFTVASSIGKSLYTAGVVPGAAGGLFIAGSNAATTVNFTGTLSGSVGSVTGAVGSVTAGVTVTTNNDKAGYSLLSTGLNLVLVDGKTLPAALQYIAASTAGKVSGAGTGSEVFVGLDGATTRLTITVDASGNRSAVTYG